MMSGHYIIIMEGREMTQTAQVSQQHGVGYRGKLGQDAWVARVTGTDARMGLRREFIAPDKTTRDHYGRAKYVETRVYYLSAGLYQEQSQGERRMLMVWIAPDGTAKMSSTSLTQARVDAMLALMDAGQDFETARIATRQ
jgi:hypothetical protein